MTKNTASDYVSAPQLEQGKILILEVPCILMSTRFEYNDVLQNMFILEKGQ